MRAVEALVRKEVEARDKPVPPRPARPRKDAGTRALEKRIGDRVGLAIAIKHKGESGEVRVRYASLGELDKLVAMLGA